MGKIILLLALLVLGSTFSCNRGKRETGEGEKKADPGLPPMEAEDKGGEAADPEAPASSAKMPPAAKKQKVVLEDSVLEVDIPGGRYVFGSETGEPYRDPSKEVDALEVEIKPFKIDRYPYPNRKVEKPLTSVTFADAKKYCEKEGKRLCTELEWETACKGPSSDQHPAGNVSDFGTEGYFEVFEWTDSKWLEPELPKPQGVVARGNTGVLVAGKPRCSHRSVRSPEKASGQVGFRCCRGEVNEIEVQSEPLKRPFEEVKDFTPDKFQLLVKSTSELEKVSKDPQMFGESDLRYVLLRRKIDIDKSYPGYIFTNNPVWWRPVRGEELLVMAGKSGKDSFVLALYHLGGGKFKHAASLVLLESDAATVDQPIPLIIVTGVDRTVINWAPCWNCSEGGSLYIDDKLDAEHTGDFKIHVSYRWGP
ncbi:MAG: SUMF1/EgtB/PvdO family nonheme iron enzyme [Pseudomonadota bacterium]